MRPIPRSLLSTTLRPVLTAAALCAALAGAAQASGSAEARAEPTPGQRFQLGLEAQTAADHAAMLQHWRAAARSGDVRAQEALGFVLLAGPGLRADVSREARCEAWRWSHAAAEQGSAIGRHQWEALGRMQRAAGLPACS